MAIGVPRPLALEKPQAVDLAQAARYFGAHGEPDAATLALLHRRDIVYRFLGRSSIRHCAPMGQKRADPAASLN